MNELGQVLTQMAILSYRYNTFRGKWSDMPDSTWLCVILGIVSTAACTFSIYVEYGLQTAMGIPVAWIVSLWLLTADTWKSNKRLLSAMFLLTILPSCLISLVGSGQPYIEIIAGMYVSANMLLLKTRQ